MDYPDIKALKKLAKACREAGIHTFKGAGIEFTLTHEAPTPLPRGQKRNHAPVNAANEVPFAHPEDSPSNDAILFWSAGEPQAGETS